MKKMLLILIICFVSVIACVTDQNVKSLSSTYDGVWEGYTDTAEGRFDIYMEIENGIMSGFFGDTKIKGYIETDKNLHINPFQFMGAQVFLETNQMSSSRIEGFIIAVSYRDTWFVLKK